MAHTSEIRWEAASEVAQEVCTDLVNTLLNVKGKFDELQELYAYVGNDAQSLADQLFLEVWSVRQELGIDAIVTVDIVGGIITSVNITTAGTGYSDQLSTEVALTTTNSGTDGIISFNASGGAVTGVQIINPGTDYTDGTGVIVLEMPKAGNVADTQANADEVSKAQDLINAMTAANEIYKAADNIAVTQEDRFVQMRRFT